MVAWFGISTSYGQSVHSGLHVPAQVLPGEAVDQNMFPDPFLFSVSEPQGDPLSSYERSRLGRWEIAKDIPPDDSVFGVQLKTPAGPIQIRFETTINGKSFRASREKTIDELMVIAKGELKRGAKEAEAVKPAVEEPAVEEPAIDEEAIEEDTSQDEKIGESVEEKPQAAADAVEPETEFEVPLPHFSPSAKDRMISYARSRGDRLTRHEARRRVADIAGGPSLLRTTKDFGAQRHETMTLFAFLDTDENGAVSPQEVDVAVQALNKLDANADGKTDWNELQLGLKPRTAKRKISAASVDWQPWEVRQSESIGDLRIAISFDDAGGKSGLTIDECKLDEQWKLVAAKTRRPNLESDNGSIVLASHSKFSVALSAVQSNAATEQISIGVALGSNALFHRLDQNSDWSLSNAERDSIGELIKSLDTNADGSLAASELPVLVRVCVSRGATAHEALANNVSVVLEPDEAEQQAYQAAPAWFTSMDEDGSRTLTRQEFLGEQKSFDKIDTDQNDLLSVAEALAAESE